MSEKLLSKLDNIIKNINVDDLCCPICKSDFFIQSKSLICVKNHTFDFNKKGYIKLIKNYKNHVDKIYNKELFVNRKTILYSGFYDKMHEKVAEIISNIFKHSVKILDVGSGEGSHTKKIVDLVNFKNCYLTDISETAIQLSTVYLSSQIIPIVCDAYNLPFKKCFDVILNILSPYNYNQIYSVLKDDGIIIKIVPTKDYLKEIRQINNLKQYEDDENVEMNFKKHFDLIKKEQICETFSIDKSQAEAFTKMTPLTESLTKVQQPKSITISLLILVGKKKWNYRNMQNFIN